MGAPPRGRGGEGSPLEGTQSTARITSARTARSSSRRRRGDFRRADFFRRGARSGRSLEETEGAPKRRAAPARCLLPLLFVGEGSPTKIDYRKKEGYQFIRNSLLEDLEEGLVDWRVFGDGSHVSRGYFTTR